MKLSLYHLDQGKCLRETTVIANPIYLLDFRNGKVSELDPADEVGRDEALAEPHTIRSTRSDVLFAALGSPVEDKD